MEETDKVIAALEKGAAQTAAAHPTAVAGAAGAVTEAVARVAALAPDESIRVTPPAAAHIRKMLAKAPAAVGLRLGVKRSGCSGWMYQVTLAETVTPDDLAFPVAGEAWVVLVAESDLPMLKGTTIDLTGDALSRRLTYHNPNAQASCGCGESFAV